MTTENRPTQESIDALRGWIEENRERFNSGVRILNDPIQVKGWVKGIMARMGTTMAFNPRNDAPHVAVYEVAKLQQSMAGVFEDLEFLDEFEEKHARYLESIRAIAGESEPEQAEPKPDNS